jgi:hypothetical protein
VIELLDVGDRVETGSYRVFARFRRAIAFARGAGAGLAVVAGEDKCSGPVQVRVRGCDLYTIGSLEVCSDSVILDGLRLEIRRRYHSRLRIGGRDPAAVRRNLHTFGAALRESAPARSVVSLSDSGTGFEAALARRFRHGAGLLLAGDLDSGARVLAGLGFGLTPSGDDFLAGVLLAMYAAGVSDCHRRRVYDAARSPNVFSEAMLRCAVEGCCIEPAHSLIHAVFEGMEGDVVRHTIRLSAVGASSGADLAAGIYSFLAWWGRFSTCGRFSIGPPASVQMPPRRVTNPPQVENLPHIRLHGGTL